MAATRWQDGHITDEHLNRTARTQTCAYTLVTPIGRGEWLAIGPRGSDLPGGSSGHQGMRQNVPVQGVGGGGENPEYALKVETAHYRTTFL